MCRNESIAERMVREAFARHYMPQPKVSVEQWLYQNLRLSKGQSADYAGEPLDLARVPHARLILDFLAHPEARELNIMKSSAAQFTTTTIGAIIHRLWDDPCNVLYLITNREEANKLSKQLWQPFLRQVFGRSVDTEEQSNLNLEINGAQVYSGSPTEGLMRNKQVGIIVEDESDTMSDSLIGGGNNLEVAQRERTKNTRGAKIIRLCTPLYAYDPKRAKIEQPRTRIHRNYLRGDQREYRCPCPKCGMWNAIVPEDLHYAHCRDLAGAWDLDRIREETSWRCPSCKKEIWDGPGKVAMVSAGRWVPTAKAESRVVWSARHTDMISLIGAATWGHIASELARTEDKPLERVAVRRSHLAEPESLHDSGQVRTRYTVLQHCGHHEKGTCPVVPWLVSLTVDVQKDAARFPWMIGAITTSGDQYVIDWGEAKCFDDLFMRDNAGFVHGLYTQPIPLRLSHSAAVAAFPDGNVPANVYVNRALIDSGYRARGQVTDESDAAAESVYAFCLRTYHAHENRFLFVPVKGRAGVQINALTIDSSVMVNGVQLPLLHYDDPAFKRTLYNIQLDADPKNPGPLAKSHPRIIFPRESDIDDALIEQLTSERLMDVERRDGRTGRMITKRVWDNPDGPNDLGDCLKWIGVLWEVARRQLLLAQTAA